MKARSVVLGVFLSVFIPLFAEAAEVINFGCPAYLIGGTPNLSALKQKNVTSIVIDPTSGISASQARAQGMQAVYYVNAFCQSDKFRCDGPRLSGSDVSGTYGEVIPQPESQFFYNNFSSQTQRVQQLGGTVIEIDNMDEYVKRGHVQAIRYLIESAGKAGINVVMKNETNASLLSLSNVVGAIAEPGSHNKGYRAAFNAAGKPTAGVLLINGSGGGDAYTSVSNVNHTGGSGEYTTFFSCTSNSAGSRTPTPPTNYQVTPPSSLLSQNQNQQLAALQQRSLLPLAQPVLQASPLPATYAQPSSVQPTQYFSPSAPSVNPTSANGSAGTVTPAPSVAESLLNLIRPVSMQQEVPRTAVVVVPSATTTLQPVQVTHGQEFINVTSTNPQPSSTFTSSGVVNQAPVRASVTGMLSQLLNDVSLVLKNLLSFLSSR